MKVVKLSEYGYEEAVLGFSLSYNTSIERTREILPKYAFGKSGESKFLESMIVWIDVTAPRYLWSEMDTYRISTKQSSSTMHTITKRELNMSDFESWIPQETLDELNHQIKCYWNAISNDPIYNKKDIFMNIKNLLPEGFLQRRIWCFSYKTLQGIYVQRYNHRLPQWRYFLDTVLSEIKFPEFIVRPTE